MRSPAWSRATSVSYPTSPHLRILPHTLPNPPMATTIKTPSHTDPETKKKEKQNEEEIKDKPSGKTVKTQKK